MVLALLPIIVVETIVLWVRAETSFWESILAASIANLASTFIGIPVALILHATFRNRFGDTPKKLRTFWQKLRMVVWHVQYVLEYEERIPDWMWPSGCLVLMVPFFLVSWVTESWVARKLLNTYPATGLDQAVFDANLVTYGLLVALLSIWLVAEVRDWSAETASNDSSKPVSEFDDPKQIAIAKPKEAKIARLYQVRPVYSPDFHETWRLANEHARRGITWLRVAEKIINRQRQTASADFVRRTEDTMGDKAA
jgi:hypothetical protein